MVKRLNVKEIRYAVTACSRGQKTATVAIQVGVSQRRIQQLLSEFTKTGRVHVPQRVGRKPKIISPKIVQQILEEYRQSPAAGVIHITRQLKKKNYDISYYATYCVLKKYNLVTKSDAKSKRRKWVRFERKYSDAMWHVDWHIMKDPRFRGLNLVTYLDDASRCVVASQLFTQATYPRMQ